LDHCIKERVDEILNGGEYTLYNSKDEKTLETLLQPGIEIECFVLRIVRKLWNVFFGRRGVEKWDTNYKIQCFLSCLVKQEKVLGV